MMTVRDLRMDDLERLERLYFQFWGEKSDVQKMKCAFAELRDNGDYIFLCAVEEDRLAGSVMGIVGRELYGECAPFLVVEDMVVDDDFRRKGVGKALFRELESRAKQKGCTQVILVTETERTDACGFYESIGFDPAVHRGYKKKI